MKQVPHRCRFSHFSKYANVGGRSGASGGRFKNFSPSKVSDEEADVLIPVIDVYSEKSFSFGVQSGGGRFNVAAVAECFIKWRRFKFQARNPTGSHGPVSQHVAGH
jgi:hypothetical protein